MSKATEYLNNLSKSELSASELNEFIKISLQENDKSLKKEGVEYFLRAIQLNPEQSKILTESELVKYSIDLQYTLKIYYKDKHYKYLKETGNKESPWYEVLMVLGVFPAC